MANVEIKIKRSEVGGSAPSTSDLAIGEVAMNLTDGKLYTKTSSDSIVVIGERNSTSAAVNDGLKTNASDIFTNFVKDMEDHGRTALHTETGFVDELEASDDMIDETNSTGYTYNTSDDYYKNTTGSADETSSKTYTTESNYLQQEWTNSNQSTSQATVSGTTVTLSSGTWPTNCVSGRISFDSGSTFENISSRDSGTQITLDSAGSNATSDYIVRMSKFDSGVVKLNTGSVKVGSQVAQAHDDIFGNNPTGTLANVFDGSYAATDFVGGTLPIYIGVEYNTFKVIDMVRLQQSANRASAIDIYGSNSAGGTGGTLLGTINPANITTSQDLTFTNTTPYLFYTLNVTNNHSGGGQIVFGSVELHGYDVGNLSGEYVSVTDTYSNITDVSNWIDINSSVITETTNNQSTYYWVSLDPASSYGNDTEIKIFHQSGSVWRTIAKNNSGTWEYNSSTTGSGWTGVSATANDMLHAVSEAISENTHNRMTKTEIEAITDAEWETSNGFSVSSVNISRGVTLYSSSNTENPQLDTFAINNDSGNYAIDLRTKQWTGTNDTPAAPASSPRYIYLFVVDELTSGTPQYAVTRNGSNYVNVTFDATWTFNGTKIARRAVIDMLGQSSGTDPRMKVTNTAGDDYKLHAVGLQTRS
jgi:hypothetical protein|tara:strand:- start:3627 stop:5561 length:1935 start_codon:yes stop_codon:yes gene_type:complete